jgi:hypothetical protein
LEVSTTTPSSAKKPATSHEELAEMLDHGTAGSFHGEGYNIWLRNALALLDRFRVQVEPTVLEEMALTSGMTHTEKFDVLARAVDALRAEVRGKA